MREKGFARLGESMWREICFFEEGGGEGGRR